MPKRFRTITMAVFAAGLTVATAFAGSVSVNATCEYNGGGTCASPNQVAYNGSWNDTFGFTYTAGTDLYSISGIIAASYGAGGTVFQTNIVAVYLGGTPSTSNDVLTVDVLQSFFDNSAGVWDGSYTESVPIVINGAIGAGSSVSANLLYTTAGSGGPQAVGLLGPYTGTGSHFGLLSTNLTLGGGNVLAGDFRFVFNFQPGTTTGGGGAVLATPEPAEMVPTAVLMLGGAAFLVRRKKTA